MSCRSTNDAPFGHGVACGPLRQPFAPSDAVYARMEAIDAGMGERDRSAMTDFILCHGDLAP